MNGLRKALSLQKVHKVHKCFVPNGKMKKIAEDVLIESEEKNFCSGDRVRYFTLY